MHFLNSCRKVAASALALAAVAAAYADGIWTATPFVGKPTSPALGMVSKMATFRADAPALRTALASAPHEDEAAFGSYLTLDLPMPTGGVESFKVWRYDIFSPELAKQIDVKCFLGRGIDDPEASIRLDIGVNGFHGMILSPKGNVFVEPISIGNMSEYASYFKHDNLRPRCESNCFFADTGEDNGGFGQGGGHGDGPGDTLKTVRLALNSTIEYTAFYGSVANAQAGATTSVNRCNQVYERDVQIRMNIVRLNCFTGADPFTNNNGGAMLAQNQTQCDADPGNANYDIGHVFSTGGGGVAGLGVVGVTGQKARGVTGSPSPIGDAFDIDYVAHEMGHQFGALHTFNGTASSCGGNRSASAAYEVGSGTTIMAYAGICGAENVQSNSDAYFHYKSIEEIWAWRTSGTGAATGTNTATGNSTPTVNAGFDYTIPQSTAYKLTGSGTDPNSDTLYYCWEQYNLGSATSAPTQYSTGPLVRSRNPVLSTTRFIPQISTAFGGLTTDNWEKLPIDNRTMVWRCTVRDRNLGVGGTGGYATDTANITTNGAAFTVTAPASGATFNGGDATTVTWTVGGGSVAANVNILLVTDGGTSYANGTATMVLANTPNDGSQSVTLPNVATTTGRIVVEAVGNIFYDVNPGNFTINFANNPAPVLLSISPNNAVAGGPQFVLTANGGNYVTSSKVRWNGADLVTTYVNAGQLTAIVPAANIANPGTASVTVFTPAPGGGTSTARTFTINNPAPVTVNPSSFTVIDGTLFGGTLSSLFTVDGNAVFILNDEASPNGTMEVVGTSPDTTPTALTMTIVARASRNDLSQFVDAYNFTTNAFVNVDFRLSSLSYVTANPTISNPTQYVNSGNAQLRAQIRFIPTSDLEAADGWGEEIDRMVWTVTP